MATNHKLNWILIAAFLLVPFGIISFGVVHAGHKFSLLLSILFIVASRIPDKYFRWFVYYIGAWVTFDFIGVMAFGIPPIVSAEAFRIQMFVTFGVILYLSIIQSSTPNEWFYNAICALAVAQSLFGLLQMVGVDPIRWFYALYIEDLRHNISKELPVGTMGNPNFWAAFIAISTTFFFRTQTYTRLKLKWSYFVFIPITAVLLSNSLTAVAALIVSLVVYFKKENLAN